MKIPFHRCLMILVIIFLIIVIAGCTEKQAPETELVAEYAEELGDQSYNITLGEGATLLERFVSEDLAIPNATLPIYYVLGSDVNEEGKTKGWIFGTVIKNDRFFIIVESDRQVLIPYKMSILDKPIHTKKIIQPSALISENRKIITDAFGKDGKLPLIRIELVDNAYTVTPSKGSTDRILRFNAFTGKPITI